VGYDGEEARKTDP